MDISHFLTPGPFNAAVTLNIYFLARPYSLPYLDFRHPHVSRRQALGSATFDATMDKPYTMGASLANTISSSGIMVNHHGKLSDLFWTGRARYTVETENAFREIPTG